MSLLERLPVDLRLRVVDLLPAQDRAKLALLNKTFQVLSLDNCSAFSLALDLENWQEQWPSTEMPKVFNLLDWLAKLAQHSQHTLRSLELHFTHHVKINVTLPRKLPFFWREFEQTWILNAIPFPKICGIARSMPICSSSELTFSQLLHQMKRFEKCWRCQSHSQCIIQG